MESVIIPGRPDRGAMHPACARLVGRNPDTLTKTEEILAEHFGLYGDLYYGEWVRTRDYLYMRTDTGTPRPEDWIDIRLPPDTPLVEGCWELARVTSYWLNTYIPETVSR